MSSVSEHPLWFFYREYWTPHLNDCVGTLCRKSFKVLFDSRILICVLTLNKLFESEPAEISIKNRYKNFLEKGVYLYIWLKWIRIRIWIGRPRMRIRIRQNYVYWSRSGPTSTSLGLHKGRPSNMRSLQSSKDNIKYFKTWKFCAFFYFCGSFLPSWIRQFECGSGSGSSSSN